MLPQKMNVKGVALGLLVLCVSSAIVTAGSLRSNILAEKLKSSDVGTTHCESCDNAMACALRQIELRQCDNVAGKSACMTLLNKSGIITKRGCNVELAKLHSNYCAENPAKCLTCDTSACNPEEYMTRVPNKSRAPAASHQCWECKEEDCEEGGKELECTAEGNDNQCYMHFDESAESVIGLGCMSDFTSEEIIELVKRKVLYICEGELCNSFLRMPKANECSQCNSNDAESCATQPTAITESVRCSLLPYTQCFERVDNVSGGITARGCLSELNSDDFYDCLTAKDGGNCRICDGRGCNVEVIPANRPKCQRCDSSSDEHCEELPAALSICPVYNKDESCVAVYEAGITKRGCRSELNCDSNGINCQICTGDGCNSVNVKRRAEEIYGIFQELPLNCNTCEGAECETGLKNPNKCEGDKFQDCLTVFDEMGKVVRRGCEAAVLDDYAAHCVEHPELCFNCKSNGCNTITDSTKYQDCLYCNAAINPDCLFKPESVTSTRKCADGCISSLYPRKSNPEVFDFVRTCHEDIEMDDRSKCTAANNCVKCDDKAKCNADILPEEGRLSCLHCNGDDCNLPVSKTCAGFSPDDQCYMFFDNVTYSALRMGCKSDLLHNQVESDIKQYFLCDGDDCNTFTNLPEANLCYVCDSATNENCAVDPAKVTAKARCQIHPYTDCYSRITKDGHTQRGCFYDLPTEDFVKCKNGDPSKMCRICTESDCNTGIYPSRRQQCHRCNSITDPKCEAEPAVTQACPLYKDEDACVTKIIAGVTHRGCHSEFNCDDANRKSCRTCADSNCNNINLSQEFIGEPGMFQELPLNCYHCEGKEECGGTSLGLVRKCEVDKYQTCTVAFGSDGSVVGRGCSDLLELTCDAEGNNCYDCKSNGCNVARQQTDYIDCVFCDAQQGDKCTFEVETITRTRKCHKTCMTALYPRTHDAEPVYELVRTCLDDMEPDDREECAAGHDENCKPCTSANCNTVDLGVRKSCYHCSGDGCQAPEMKTCRATMTHDQCFIEYDETGDIVEMGCKSKYDPQDVKTLMYAKRLWLCDDENCNDIENIPEPQKCYLCNSRTDRNCAVAPDNLRADTTCSKQPYTQCYSRVLTGGHTERGCLSSLEDEQFLNCLNGANATECAVCSGANCNKQIHPADRRSCHICNSADMPNCETSPNAKQICSKYVDDEQCVIAIDNDGLTLRGCGSELQCDASDSTNCQVCDSNDCNNSNLKRKSDGKPGMWQELPLTCQSCSGITACATGAVESKCSSEHEYCMTVFDQTGAVQQRGCSDSVESQFGTYCDTNSPNCHNCNSNNCNTATAINDYNDCVYCDSEANANCVFQPDSVSNRRKCNGACMTALYLKPNSSVYALTRTCLDDKDEADRSACNADSEFCASCTGGACNTIQLPENRWSCNVCEDADCEESIPQACKYYRKNDQCYMLFNAASDIVSLGCVSDLEDAFVTSNRNLLYMCDDESNCNSWENIPQPKRCVECDSNDDADCASYPNNVPWVTTCTALPNTQCFTQVYSDGSTKRGCVSKLSNSQMLSCLSGNSTSCTTCNEDGCNKEIFPADRRRCHRCNSKEDPTCENAPEASAACPFYSESEFCSTKVVNGFTYRDCSSEFQCEATDHVDCRMCTGSDNCNTVDLISLNVGYPGKWQTLPINCYTCEGQECNSGAGALRKCENNNLQTCGTVFAANGSIVMRGCSDKIYENTDHATYCDANTNNCKFCKSSGCNTATNLADYVDCVYCDAADNADCVRDVTNVKRTRACHKKCMTGMYPRVNEANPAYVLARGCLDDLEYDDRPNCESGDSKFCKACDGASCNTIALPETPRLKCNVCNGNDCMTPRTAECLAYREHDQCYALFDTFKTNEVLRMGCASDLDNSFLVAQKRSLLLCDEDECNVAANFPKPTGCNYCNSNSTMACATNPKAPITGVGCDDMPYTQCFTRVDEMGNTIRGCLSDLPDDVFDKCISADDSECAICDEHQCNSAIHPPNRRSCHRCDSSLDATCIDSPQGFASICPIFNAEDSCVSKLEGGRILRGCSTDFTCDTTDSKTCRICSSDNCNMVNLLDGYIGDPGKWQGLPLNCYHCEGADCANANGIVHKCEGNNMQNCVTVFNEDGTSVQKRGCSDAVEETHSDYCEANSGKCLACKSNGCNTAKSLSEYTDCYFCDSTDGRGCSVNFNTTSRTRKCRGDCMVALYPRSNADNPAYEMSRSCLDDMDLDERERCIAGNLEFCEACEGARCNMMSMPAERHECLKCVDSDCEDMEPMECSAHQANDQCYILYDNENSIANMGCRSEFETDVVTELIRQKQLILCDGKNCNRPDIVQTKTCLVCDSRDDPRCATNPNLVDNSLRCSTMPYTECFTRVDDDGHTTRGCIASLPTEAFYRCLTNSDGLCETCSTNDCNSIDVYPADRMRCHQCDSNSNDRCTSLPDSNRVCPIYDANDACVTNLHNSVTQRGCASSFKCHDETDKRNCRTCKTTGCNTIDLAKVSEDGEPGKWQDVPLNCRFCASESECAAGSTFNVCTDNPYQNCMTVFNEAGNVAQRGCSDAVEQAHTAYCDEHPDKCLRCNSNGCNMATSLDDYVECLACDTNANGDCVSDLTAISKTRHCYKQCMTVMYPREQEENPAYHLARSCLDDMDLDDREDCAAGFKEHCAACEGDKCNSEALPEERLSCNICSGDDCQMPQAKTCPTYREGDQCYVLFDEQRSITAMGCRSEFSNADANFLFRQKRLYLCDDDNCNDVDSLPAAQTCTLCNSRTDVSCAIQPNTLNTNVTCNAVPFTECYSRVLSDGATERGCLSNLYDDDFLNCLSDDPSRCQACKGELCNLQVFPSGRASCHICDSSFDPSCEGSPDNISICPKYDPTDTCVTAFRNGVTLRGCSSTLNCNGANSRLCSKCSGDGCNTINLAKRQDDNFGKWQDLPLRCHVCSGEECDDTATTNLATCENNNEQDCVVVFDENGKVIERGCADAVEETHGAYCDEHKDSCYNCKSNECNTASSLNEYDNCVYCDSHKDLSCLWDPHSSLHSTRKCRGGCMTALYPSDSSSNPAYDLIRTCLDDKDTADQNVCSNGRDANCKACTDGNCNTIDLPEDRMSCFYCSGDDCEEPTARLCPLYKKQDQCYIWFDSTNSVSEMGCLSSFRNQELETIIKTKRVHICNDSDNCNSLDKLHRSQKCALCDSKTDALCAVNAKAVATFDECTMMPFTGCYSNLGADGHTTRGCATQLSDDNFVNCVLGKNENCEYCNGDACNREIFPAERQQCYTCTSLDDPDCESFPTRMQPCPIVSASETCKSALSSNETVRGCSSEVYCDNSDSFTCRSCSGTSCNSIDLYNKVDDGYHGAWQELPLRCHECIGEHCHNSLGPTVTCNNNNNKQQDCMTVFEADGEIRRRGCEDAVEDYEDLYCRLHPELCFKCKSNECNIAWSLNEYVNCAYCNSTQNTACITDPDSGNFASRKCYKECMITMLQNVEVIRSCLDDKELFVQHDCRVEPTNGKECTSCNDGNCNTFVYPRDRLKCHVCTGSGCSSSTGQYCLQYDENDFCFAKYEDGQVDLMGCGSSHNKSDIDAWIAQNKLYRCEDNDCNDLTKLPSSSECVSCDSSKTPECAQNPMSLDRFETCNVPSNQCVTRLNSAGDTLRGCFSALDQAEQESCERTGTCAVCSSNKCNTQIFPSDRRKCHICNSVDDDGCEKNPNSLLICPIYAKDDRCVAKNNNGIIERGCATDKACDENDTADCQYCDTDGCNTAVFDNSASALTTSTLLMALLVYIATNCLNRR